jgi:hypothetical protein
MPFQRLRDFFKSLRKNLGIPPPIRRIVVRNRLQQLHHELYAFVGHGNPPSWHNPTARLIATMEAS